MFDQIIDISNRLRGLREVSGLSQEDFAKSCHIDPKAYAKAESGSSDISVNMLQQIARENHISLDELMFGYEPHMTKYFLTRRGKGQSVSRTKAYRYLSLAWGFKGRLADPFYVTVDPSDDPITLNQHPGQELNIVVKGQLLISIDGKELVLNAGDSIYFNSQYAHGMKALGGKPARFIAVVI
ncbi:MAG: helix-turn-helix transcriptional regulator [Bacteroidaceae bacterium]|nr:helix-turn-helix transcriptional regulator [Bacteroidaceae bacterium]